MTTIEDLVIKHKAATTHLARAQIERDLWDNHSTTEIRNKHTRERWLKLLIGESTDKTGHRLTLLNAGEEIAAIWQRIDGPEQMPLATAWGQLKNAQAYAEADKIALSEGVAIALAEYDTWPKWHTINGQEYRRPHHVSTAPRKRRRAPQISPDNDRKFWLEVKHKINTFLDERLAHVDHLTANKMKRDFGIRLQTLYDEFSAKINAVRIRSKHENGQDVAMLKFAQVREACITLAIDPPGRFGDAIDLDRADKNKRRLAVNYHPDTGPDPANPDPRRTEQYNNIIAAHTTLELYNDQINGKAN